MATSIPSETAYPNLSKASLIGDFSFLNRDNKITIIMLIKKMMSRDHLGNEKRM